MPNGFAIAVDKIFENPIVFVIFIAVIFGIWIGKKLFRKYHREKIIEEKPTVERFDFVDTEEKPVVIQWKGSKKPEPEPDENEEIYACESCPEGRLHTRKMIFQCPDCGKWFCNYHYQPHINKKHRGDYVIRSNENGGATYSRSR